MRAAYDYSNPSYDEVAIGKLRILLVAFSLFRDVQGGRDGYERGNGSHARQS